MDYKLKPLDQQVMVITGASSGIGLATAVAAAGQGATVVLVARSENVLNDVCAQINAHGRKAMACVADVSDRDSDRARGEQQEHEGVPQLVEDELTGTGPARARQLVGRDVGPGRRGRRVEPCRARTQLIQHLRRWARPRGRASAQARREAHRGSGTTASDPFACRAHCIATEPRTRPAKETRRVAART